MLIIWEWGNEHKKHILTLRGKKLSTAERQRINEQVEAERARREAEQAELHAKAAKKALGIWDASTPAGEDRPYLVHKGIKPHGLKQDAYGNTRPAISQRGRTRRLHKIIADGRKRFLKDSDVTGAYFVIGEMYDVLCIAEGFATAATIHGATRFAQDAVAFNEGNLLPVAKVFESFPGTVIVCADDDWKRINKRTGKPENIGVISATKAAAAINSRLAVPAFGEHRGEKDTDFLTTWRGFMGWTRCGPASLPPRAWSRPEEEASQAEEAPKPEPDALRNAVRQKYRFHGDKVPPPTRTSSKA